MAVLRYNGQPLPELGLSLIVFRHPFFHLYFAEHSDYWAHDYGFKLRLHRHASGIFAGGIKLNYWPFTCCIVQVIKWRPGIGGESSKGLVYFSF